MITQLKDGTLFCNRCKRKCDNTCFSSCKYYKSTCTSCKYWNDETGYCDDCTLTCSKWEDAYEEDAYDH